MIRITFALFAFTLLIVYSSCKRKDNQPQQFDRAKWLVINEDDEYPYREAMLKDLFDRHLVHGSRDSALSLLGPPTRTDSNHIFYKVSQRKLGFFPLGTTSLVVRFDHDTVKWARPYNWRH